MQVDTKPASDVIAGAVARAASQGTIHPLDTLKVQLQSGKGRQYKPNLSKISQLVPPPGVRLSPEAPVDMSWRILHRAAPSLQNPTRTCFLWPHVRLCNLSIESSAS